MIEWVYVFVPALVLPIIMLFRFVGCASIAGISGPTPKDPTPGIVEGPGLISTPYRDIILGSPDVIAYWRLTDDDAMNTEAKDEKGFQNGQYMKDHALRSVAPTATTPGSEGRYPADFDLRKDSLIESDPAVKCRNFQGGYVLVRHKPGLYSDQFTIEAWVKAETFAQGFEHTLFYAGGKYASPPGTGNLDRGFRIFVDRHRHWQASLNNSQEGLFKLPPFAPIEAPAHIALTVENKQDGPAGAKKCTLYINGKATVSTDVDSYVPPDGAPLFIGVENEDPIPAVPPEAGRLTHPVLCRVQEVVLHRQALSEAQIKYHVNAGRK
jgi:hypothetical protein